MMYDGILTLKNPENTTTIGYAEDIAIVVVAKKLHDMDAICASMILSFRTWLQKAGIELPEHKTEAVLISNRKKSEVNQYKSWRACYPIKYAYKVFRSSVGSPAKL